MERPLTHDAWSPPAEFDGFSLRERIGRGGMGQVFLAYEAALDRVVAIKFITAAAPSRTAHERFLVEARAVARLQHPNVVAIYRLGQVSGRPYLASEYVAGKSLDRVPRPVMWPHALRIALALSSGLAEAHRRGVLHRDVKPANVIEAADGSIKLVDFGLAKLLSSAPSAPSAADEPPDSAPRSRDIEHATLDELALPWTSMAQESAEVRARNHPFQSDDDELPDPRTITGAVLGTPLFLAPELWTGLPASPRSDVYAAGLLLYELCASELPFAHLSGHELATYVKTRDLPQLAALRPDLPGAFAAVVDHAVRRDPAQRFADAVELRDALEAVNSVFQSFRDLNRASSVDDASLVAASFARLSRQSDALMTAVYDELFARAPELRPLFPIDIDNQRAKLFTTIRLCVEGLRHPERLLPVLEDLGRRHRDYGGLANHLSTFGAALLACLERFDEAWTAETASSWGRAYDALAGAMVQGMSVAPGSPSPAADARDTSIRSRERSHG